MFLLPAAGGGDADASGATHLRTRSGEALTKVDLAVQDADGDGADDLLVGDWNTGANNGDVWLFRGPVVGALGELLAGAAGVGEVRVFGGF